MGRLEKQKRLLMEEANKVLLGEAYEGIIKEGDVPCDIWCKKKIAKNGSSGDVVKMIQHYLAKGTTAYGPYNPGSSGGGMIEGCSKNYKECDGKFRSETKKAVMEFQKDAGIKVDGVVGSDTLEKICELLGDSSQPNKVLCGKQCQCGESSDKQQGDESLGKQQDGKGWDQLIDTADCDKLKACLKEFWYYNKEWMEDNDWDAESPTDILIGCIRGKSGGKQYDDYNFKITTDV